MNVGTYDGTTARCEVQFFMAGNNSACNGGKYNKAVNDILASVSKKRPDVEHISIYRTPYAHLRIRNNVPSPVQMAKDMLWIVENTLGQLAAIPDS